MQPVRTGALIIAGYDRSLFSVSVAQKLQQAGHKPAAVIIGYPFSRTRIKAILRTRGAGALIHYLLRSKSITKSDASPLKEFAEGLGLESFSLKSWCRKYSVPCYSVIDINAQRAVDLVRRLQPSLTIYTGGGILRRQLIEAAGRRVLNAHSGPLPAIRGMNACEWSLLLNEPLSVTIHFINEGIDTGPELQRVAVMPQIGDNIQVLRERCSVAGVLGLVNWAQKDLSQIVSCSLAKDIQANDAPRFLYRQCFVLAPALRELLESRLPRLIENKLRRQLHQ